MDIKLYAQLLAAGVAPKELTATRERIPDDIRRVLPADQCRPMIDGFAPPVGFGLAGNAGGGKSMALASLVIKMAESYYTKCLAASAPNAIDCGRGRNVTNFGIADSPKVDWLLWVSWSDALRIIKRHGIDGFADDLVSRYCKVPLLILDDLGRERIKGTYNEDFAASRLDEIIDYRYRFQLPLLSSCNLNPQEVSELYGSSLASRLLGHFNMIYIEGLKDMRL